MALYIGRWMNIISEEYDSVKDSNPTWQCKRGDIVNAGRLGLDSLLGAGGLVQNGPKLTQG